VGKVGRAPFASWHEAAERMTELLAARRRCACSSYRPGSRQSHNPELLRRHGQVAEQRSPTS
jgi:hypothetical protein